MSIKKLWGKYSDEAIHPLLCHMLDVASVAKVLLETMDTNTKKAMTEGMGFKKYDEEIFFAFCLFLIALHDIGKASPGFQWKVPIMKKKLEAEGFSFPFDQPIGNHSQVGQYVLPPLLEEVFGMDEELSSYLSVAVTSHHGTVLGAYEDMREDIGGSDWDTLRKEIVETLKVFFSAQDAPTVYPRASALMMFAGLCSVADWIGSSEEVFPYLGSGPLDLKTYYARSCDSARQAVDALSFREPERVSKTFNELFPLFDAPNPVQEAAMCHAGRSDNPMLMIVEAPMGEGKTEAALAAYAELASKHPVRGLYFALPTQATGNMMLPRIEEFLKRFSTQEAELHLLHGNADLNEDYRQLRARAVYDDAGRENGVRATGWFTARKRGLLAEYGVGTVDQILVAALRSRHLFVRLYGLASKVVVIDEVHAYDAYMSELLEVLLGWLARLGTSVILLSATLPTYKRDRLLRSFSRDAQTDPATLYPCISSVAVDGEVSAETLHGLKRSTARIIPLPVKQGDWDEVLTLLETKLSDGGCAACIVNTVAEAQKLYRLVKSRFEGDDVLLFHARFTLEKRLEVERDVIARYGKSGERPHRGIVIATQVIEQSLDVDFDLMITALSPVDLVLQRLGRLHRHVRQRPERLRERDMVLLAPERLQGERTDFGSDGYVYYPAILYKTAMLFQQKGDWKPLEVRFPDGLSELVEAVYSGECDEDAVQKWEDERTGKEYADEFMATQYAIPKIADAEADTADLLDGMNNRFSDDPDEPSGSTRLGPESLSVVILPEGIEPEVRSRAEVRDRFARSVKVQTRWVVEQLKKVEIPKSWEEEPLLRYCRPMRLDEVLSFGKRSARYDPELGFVISTQQGGEDDV